MRGAPRALPQAVPLLVTTILRPQGAFLLQPVDLLFSLLAAVFLPRPPALSPLPTCHPLPCSSLRRQHPWPGFSGEALGVELRWELGSKVGGREASFFCDLSPPKLCTHVAGREAMGTLPPAAAEGLLVKHNDQQTDNFTSLPSSHPWGSI